MPISTAGADWVIRPTEMKSTPVSAMPRMVSRLTPPEASSGTRPATSSTASAQGRHVHIVEQQAVGAGVERFFDLLDAVDLDLHLQAGVRGLRGAHRGADAAGDRDVIVLDQHAVVEPHPVVVRAAHASRIFLERAKAGDGLARVEQRRAGAGDRVDIAPGQGRDSRQMLERVERRALGGEHRPRQPLQLQDRAARADRVAVVRELIDLHVGIERAEEGGGDVEAGDDDRLAAARARR